MMGVLAKGRKSVVVGDSYHLREPAAPYSALLGGKKDDIGSENTCFGDIKLQYSISYLAPIPASLSSRDRQTQYKT